MATLKNRASARKICLRADHVFGRGRSADTLLENLDASQLHASIRWTGKSWELHDHSRNGTVLDGALISNTKGLDLKVGSVIGFGQNGSSMWEVVDLAPPSSLLWPINHDAQPIILGCSNLLPNGESSELSIHCSTNGQWICTSTNGSWVIEEGDEVRLADKSWCFIMGSAVTSTMENINHDSSMTQRSEPTLFFKVSLDEEHVWLELDGTDIHIDLGERSHHYTLLTLARLRLTDAQRNIDSHTQGWVDLDRLAKMLGIDQGHLNIQIFRMRKQLALSVPTKAHVPELIERRRGSLRFGNLPFRIVRGAQLEANFHPPVPTLHKYQTEAFFA